MCWLDENDVGALFFLHSLVSQPKCHKSRIVCSPKKIDRFLERVYVTVEIFFVSIAVPLLQERPLRHLRGYTWKYF